MGNFFGGMFDFNGDGKTDPFEQAMGMYILDGLEREERDELDDFDDDSFED